MRRQSEHFTPIPDEGLLILRNAFQLCCKGYCVVHHYQALCKNVLFRRLKRLDAFVT